MDYKDSFKVDESNSDDATLYIDVPGYGSVQIVKDDAGGLEVNIYQFAVTNHPAAQAYATRADLWDE